MPELDALMNFETADDVLIGVTPIDKRKIRVGDHVLVLMKVTKVDLPRAFTVEYRNFNGVGMSEVEIYPEQVVAYQVYDIPAEPPNGTWLFGPSQDHPGQAMFCRDDEDAPHTEGARDQRHWASEGTWYTWPEAVARGADPANVLTRPLADAAPPPIVWKDTDLVPIVYRGQGRPERTDNPRR